MPGSGVRAVSWELDEPDVVVCPYCHGEHDAAVFAEQGCTDREED